MMTKTLLMFYFSLFASVFTPKKITTKAKHYRAQEVRIKLSLSIALSSTYSELLKTLITTNS